MSFSKEICQCVIRNAAVFESGLIDDVQKTLFTVINARLESRIRAIGGWHGRYELVSGAADETYFAPVSWPTSSDGRWRACYKLSETNEGNSYWLSSAIGVNDVKLCFVFWLHGGLGGHSKGEIERRLVTVANTDAVRAAGLVQGTENTLYLPFVFDTETLATEYPKVEKTLAPFETALDKLMKAHPQLDAIVQDLTAKRS